MSGFGEQSESRGRPWCRAAQAVTSEMDFLVQNISLARPASEASQPVRPASQNKLIDEQAVISAISADLGEPAVAPRANLAKVTA